MLSADARPLGLVEGKRVGSTFGRNDNAAGTSANQSGISTKALVVRDFQLAANYDAGSRIRFTAPGPTDRGLKVDKTHEYITFGSEESTAGLKICLPDGRSHWVGGWAGVADGVVAKQMNPVTGSEHFPITG
jgi:hypothetical protein